MSAVLLVWGLVFHLVADWLLQNDWMATHKANPRHPAGYVHALIQTIAMAFVFPLPVAIVLGIVHWLVDLRFALIWWRRVYRQTVTGPVALDVALWGDQVVHIATIAIAAWLVSCRSVGMG